MFHLCVVCLLENGSSWLPFAATGLDSAKSQFNRKFFEVGMFEQLQQIELCVTKGCNDGTFACESHLHTSFSPLNAFDSGICNLQPGWSVCSYRKLVRKVCIRLWQDKSCSSGRPCTSPFGFGQICKKFPRHMQKACQHAFDGKKNQRSKKLTMRITQGNPSMLNSVEHEGSVKVFVSVSHAFCASSNLPILIIFQ